MKKTIFYFVLLFIGFVSCQKNTNSQTTEITKKGLLWQISGKGLKTSYLYGTMHVSNEKVIKLSDMAMDELDKCQVMAGELVLKESDMMPMLMSLIMKDTTLEMLLSPAEYQIVHKKLEEKMGFMATMLEKIKPVFISVMLSEQANQKSNEKDGEKTETTPPFGKDFGKGFGGLGGLGGGNQKPPLDMYLQDKAKQKGKEVVGLETVEEQLAAFNTITLKEQAKMLYETVTSENKAEGQSLEGMLDLYYRQEIDSLYMLTNQALSSNSNDKLLIERNTNMADRMEKIMKEKSLFTAVGAAHLAGKTGLIDLLRKRGYRVEVIK